MLSKSQIKYIQSLGHKKFRDEHGVFVAEGPKLVHELMHSTNVELMEIFALDNWIKDAKRNGNLARLTEISEAELERISLLSTPNQVLALVKKFESPVSFQTAGTITLALDNIQDPGNLGTIVRIADWFGVRQVVCSNDCADMYNPKVVQSTMGSIARVKIHYTLLPEWLREQHAPIYATALEGRNVQEMEPVSEGIFVIGNESKGIRKEINELANVLITIPRIGEAESLNAAVATGIVLSHLV